MSILQVYSSIPLLTSILGKLETNISSSSSSKAVAATRREGGEGGGSFNSREKKSTKNIVTFQKCFELKFYI